VFIVKAKQFVGYKVCVLKLSSLVSLYIGTISCSYLFCKLAKVNLLHTLITFGAVSGIDLFVYVYTFKPIHSTGLCRRY